VARGAITAICINDPRTHARGASHDRGRVAAGPSRCCRARSISDSDPVRQNPEAKPTGDNRVTFPTLITDLN